LRLHEGKSIINPDSNYNAFADHQEHQIARIDVGSSSRSIALDPRRSMVYGAL
jgi:hypothetical protein